MYSTLSHPVWWTSDSSTTRPLAALASKTFMEKIITNDLIFDIIFTYCSPVTLFQLFLTCRACSIAVRGYHRVAYNINRTLSRFFTNPIEFRTLQARTRTLISGSVALQYFDRTFYPESDLDLYIPFEHREEVGMWLLANGYDYSPYEHQPADFKAAIEEEGVQLQDMVYEPIPGVTSVFNFIQQDPKGDKKLNVQCIIALDAPIEAILSFHSTVVMNVISFDTAYCLYPRQTLHTRHSLITMEKDHPKFHAAVEKYTNRGWTMISNVTWDHREDIFKLFPWDASPRFLADRLTWKIPLDMHGITLPQRVHHSIRFTMTKDPVVVSAWELLYSFGTREKAKISMDLGHGSSSHFSLYFKYFCDEDILKELVRLAICKERKVTGVFPRRHHYDEDIVDLLPDYLAAMQLAIQ